MKCRSLQIRGITQLALLALRFIFKPFYPNEAVLDAPKIFPQK